MKKFFITIALLIFAPILLLAGLNYSGMCIPEGRWMTDEEQINLLTKNFRGPVDTNFLINEGYDHFRNYETIPYKSPEEFLKENPNCCRTLGRDGSKSYWQPDWIMIFFGSWNNTIEIKYKARLLSPEGEIIELPDHKEYPTITNCGRIHFTY